MQSHWVLWVWTANYPHLFKQYSHTVETFYLIETTQVAMHELSMVAIMCSEVASLHA